MIVSGVENMEDILIHNAYENNLKHINVGIPTNAFTCVTGVSGCGKSSLVYDTLYAESQRNFLESMSTNMFGQKIMDKPKVESIENLRPALSVSQNYYNTNPRSTVGTLTDISHYLRTLFALVSNYKFQTSYTDSFFSANNPNSCCPYCDGLGEEYDISESAVIPDRKKSLRKNGILYYSGSSSSAEHKLLLAVCDYFGINPDKSIEQLSQTQLDQLLYRTDTLSFQLSFKNHRGVTRRKVVKSKGVMVELKEKLLDIDTPSTFISISKYLFKKPCTHCHGLKLREEVLNVRLCDMNIAEVENIKIGELSSWLSKISESCKNCNISSQVEQLITNICHKSECLKELSVDYLSLNRSIPTLSGGEIQRIRVANQLNCPLRGLIYILDEPCRGLHPHNISNISTAAKNLVAKGNTLIAIEHNPKFIQQSDRVIELGPMGGLAGGMLIYNGTPKEQLPQIKFKESNKKIFDMLQFRGISFHNLHNQNVSIPIGQITCITGVSGSGKSSIVTVIEESIIAKRPINCSSIDGLKFFKSVQRVNQQPIGKNSRSTIVSYLDIFDEIRSIYSEISKNKFSASDFSMNVKGGRCECCQGNGTLKIELNYLPESYITCPECKGTRFRNEILSIKYHGKNIYELLSTQIQDIIGLFMNNEQIYKKLQCMIDIGLGYLNLGQMSMHLSGGESQRIKLARVLGNNSSQNNLFILDEPTAGLSLADIKKIKNIIQSVKEMGNTIIIIDHNLSFIADIADYLIDLGLNTGEDGGTIIAEGNPYEVSKNPKSSWEYEKSM